ncbi:MAG: hypothetical protein NKF70_12890 [Methanobacterium sp. ERen5]|nr:MAG: hypothetical protein NKF70_12890 [Methanobacterium sp. ERen5]
MLQIKPIKNNLNPDRKVNLQYMKYLKGCKNLEELLSMLQHFQFRNISSINSTDITYNKTLIYNKTSTNVTYNVTLNSTNLDAIGNYYNQMFNEYNSSCVDLVNMNAICEDLNLNRTQLLGLEASLLDQLQNFVYDPDDEGNAERYEELNVNLNDTKEKIRAVNMLQNEVNVTIGNLTQKKNDYETLLSGLNQTLIDKKITPETEKMIETIAQKYNQTMTDVNDTSKPTESNNTASKTVKPDTTSKTDKSDANSTDADVVIDPTIDDNTPTNDTNSTEPNNDVVSGLDGAIAGFSLLGYSLPIIIKFWNVYKTGKVSQTMTSYYLHHLTN